MASIAFCKRLPGRVHERCGTWRHQNLRFFLGDLIHPMASFWASFRAAARSSIGKHGHNMDTQHGKIGRSNTSSFHGGINGNYVVWYKSFLGPQTKKTQIIQETSRNNSENLSMTANSFLITPDFGRTRPVARDWPWCPIVGMGQNMSKYIKLAY
jgi:hypothetical protein